MNARRSSSKLLLILVLCAVLAGCGSGGGPASVAEASSVPVDREWVIPAGTFDRLRSGENVEILPARMTLDVGTTIRVRNDDVEGGTVGPFYVGAGETLTQRFTSKGTYEGLCNVHPSGRIYIEVA